MKKICILGWYGTETIGDRAILDGIFILLDKVFCEYELYLGSLNPFFSERTLLEDGWIYRNSSPKMKIQIVDETDKNELYPILKSCDVVMMGGGPIMHINELKLITNAFKYAKKCKAKTMLFGVGLGPLNYSYFVHETNRLMSYSDYIIFRDSLSYDYAVKLYGPNNKFITLCDPAIFSVVNFLTREQCKKGKYAYVACNLREFPRREYGDSETDVENIIYQIVSLITESGIELKLIPMHTFSVGGDDRKYLYEVKKKFLNNNITIPERPLSLYETYDVYRNADVCIGMRYHSVVLQTFLNGNNIILDYTDAQNGKIKGFFNTFNIEEEYKTRYISLRENTSIDSYSKIIKKSVDLADSFDFRDSPVNNKVKACFNKYVELLKK